MQSNSDFINADLITKIDVPQDGNCLFWAVILAYIIPVKNDYGNMAAERFHNIIDDYDRNYEKIYNFLESLKQIKTFDSSNDDVCDLCNSNLWLVQQFRTKVLNLMTKRNACENSITVPDIFLNRNNEYKTIFAENLRKQFESAVLTYRIDTQNLLIENNAIFGSELAKINNSLSSNGEFKKFVFDSYIQSMRDDCAWAGPHELTTISEMLFSNIHVHMAAQHTILYPPQPQLNNTNLYLFCDKGYYCFGLIKSCHLFNALKRAKLDKALMFAKIGVDNIIYKNDTAYTLLHYAAKTNNIQITHSLLNQGAEPNCKNYASKIPSDYASDKDYFQSEITQYLNSRENRKRRLSIEEFHLFENKKLKESSSESFDINDSSHQLSIVPTSEEFTIPSMAFTSESQFSTQRNIFTEDYFSSQTQSVDGLKKSFHGISYQLKLIMLFVRRGLEKNYRYDLATEYGIADGFDDIVFKYGDDGSNDINYKLVQVKHRQDIEKKISLNDLLSSRSGDFSLHKYFSSFLRIVQDSSFTDASKIEVIICANIDFKYGHTKDGIQLSRDIFIEDNDESGIFEKMFLRFSEDFINNEKFLKRLLDETDFHRLVKLIYECLVYDKKIENDSTDSDLLRTYLNPLLSEVIDAKTKSLQNNFISGCNISTDSYNFRLTLWQYFLEKRTYIKFPKDFQLTNPNEFATILVKLIHNHLKNNKTEVQLHKSNEYIKKNPDDLTKLAGWFLVKQNDTIKISSDFFQLSPFLPNNLNEFRTYFLEKIKNINIDLTQLSFRITNFESYNEIYFYSEEKVFWQKISKKCIEFPDKLLVLLKPERLENLELIAGELSDLIIQNNSYKIFIKREKQLRKYIDELSRTVFCENRNKIIFTKQFINDKCLSENISKFRAILIDRIGNERSLNLDKYHFEISNFLKFNLPERYDYSILKKFLHCLRFAVNQPNERDLGEKIKEEISREFGSRDSKTIYCQFLAEIMDLLNSKKANTFEDRNAKYFFELIRNQLTGSIQFRIENPIIGFHGRDDVLNQLYMKISSQTNNEVTVLQSSVKGVGKAETAKKFAQQFGNNYNNIIWINAENFSTIAESFFELAKSDQLRLVKRDSVLDTSTFHIQNLVKKIYRYLLRRNENVLIIFHKAQKYESTINSDGTLDDGIWTFLPQEMYTAFDQRLRFLVTSATINWKPDWIVPLPIFDKDESAQFIRESLSINQGSQEQEISILSHQTNHNPSELAEAIKTISSMRECYDNVGIDKYTISKYLQ